jgi:hypothetical protein
MKLILITIFTIVAAFSQTSIFGSLSASNSFMYRGMNLSDETTGFAELGYGNDKLLVILYGVIPSATSVAEEVDVITVYTPNSWLTLGTIDYYLYNLKELTQHEIYVDVAVGNFLISGAYEYDSIKDFYTSLAYTHDFLTTKVGYHNSLEALHLDVNLSHDLHQLGPVTPTILFGYSTAAGEISPKDELNITLKLSF